MPLNRLGSLSTSCCLTGLSVESAVAISEYYRVNRKVIERLGFAQSKKIDRQRHYFEAGEVDGLLAEPTRRGRELVFVTSVGRMIPEVSVW